MINNPFDSPKVMKRDFALIPLYFLLLNVGQIIVLGIGLIVIETFNMKIPHNGNAIASSFGDIISFLLLFYIFYKMHRHYIIPIVLERIKQAKAYIWLVIIIYIVYLSLLLCFTIFAETLSIRRISKSNTDYCTIQYAMVVASTLFNYWNTGTDCRRINFSSCINT